MLPTHAPTSPRVETDSNGDYLPCPSCKARVPMKSVEVRGRRGFRLAEEALRR